MRRRPAPRSTGAVPRALPLLLAGLLVTLLAGCSRTLEVDAPALSGQAASTCRSLLDALPEKVNDQDRREVDGSGFAAAWGDPAIVLRCGVRKPAAIDEFAPCTDVNGVGWFIPEDQGNNEPVTMTTLNRATYVQVELPAAYFPPATAMVDLAPAVKKAVRQLSPCE